MNWLSDAIDIRENNKPREAWATVTPITARCISPLSPQDMDLYASLLNRAEDLENDIAGLEKQLRLKKAQKETVDIHVCQVLARRIG